MRKVGTESQDRLRRLCRERTGLSEEEFEPLWTRYWSAVLHLLTRNGDDAGTSSELVMKYRMGKVCTIYVRGGWPWSRKVHKNGMNMFNKMVRDSRKLLNIQEDDRTEEDNAAVQDGDRDGGVL